MKLKTFLAACVAVVSFAACAGLGDDETAYYKYEGLEELEYIIGEEDTVIEFAEELAEVLSDLDGTDFTQAEIKNKTKAVVREYDYGVMRGTFWLTKSATENGTYKKVQSYTLHLNSKYDVKSGAGLAKYQPAE